MAVSVGLVVIGLIALGVGVASSSEGHRSGRVRPSAESFGVSIQPVFDAAGNPLLVANFSPDGSSATVGWAICRPGGASCRSVGTDHGELQPGPEPAGTRFVASAEYRGQAYSASVHWLGAVRALRTPRLVGEARLGGVVNPVAGTWAGGWDSISTSLASRRAGRARATTAGCWAAASTGVRIAARAPGSADGSPRGICSPSTRGCQKTVSAPARAISTTPTCHCGSWVRQSFGRRRSRGSPGRRGRP